MRRAGALHHPRSVGSVSHVVRALSHPAPDYARYERDKRAWIDAHPMATPRQYEQAMRAIANRCRV